MIILYNQLPVIKPLLRIVLCYWKIELSWSPEAVGELVQQPPNYSDKTVLRLGLIITLELGSQGIRVNVVSPGLTETDATAWMPSEQKQAAGQGIPLQRIGQPDDIAGAILFLASEQAQYITGVYLPVSGGDLML